MWCLPYIGLVRGQMALTTLPFTLLALYLHRQALSRPTAN
jgi:hypothetical protein